MMAAWFSNRLKRKREAKDDAKAFSLSKEVAKKTEIRKAIYR